MVFMVCIEYDQHETMSRESTLKLDFSDPADREMFVELQAELLRSGDPNGRITLELP